MAKPQSGTGSGTVTISAAEVETMLRQATGLPTNFFVSMAKAKVLSDGSLEGKYNFSTEGAPPSPLEATTTEETT
jgi:hypothetical protein